MMTLTTLAMISVIAFMLCPF